MDIVIPMVVSPRLARRVCRAAHAAAVLTACGVLAGLVILMASNAAGVWPPRAAVLEPGPVLTICSGWTCHLP